jgi:hypothetical protein
MKVFISYAAQDRELAKDLASRLSEADFSVWYADEHALPGDNLPLKTGEALAEADAMIVLVSPEAARSEGVRQEINYALASPKYAGRLLPVIVRETEDIPWILRKFTHVRAGKNRAEVSRRIIEQLQHSGK